MPDHPEIDGLLTPAEHRVAEFLDQRRPVPAPRFRGLLGRRLAALDPGWGPRPERLWLIVVTYLVAGLVLIGLGALVGV